MKTSTLTNQASWREVLELLPCGYEEEARARGALVRRRRIRSAGDLLRLVLLYAVGDLSLRLTAGVAKAQGVADLSDVAVLKRLRGAVDWLAWLVVRLIGEGEGLGACARRRIRILDASVVAGPRASGTQWRLHLGLDLERETISSLELTGPEGGETLKRHTVVPGELLLVDRGYAHRAGVRHVMESGGHVLVRLNWQNFPLEDGDGRRVDVLGLVRPLGVGEVVDVDLGFRDGGRWFPVRFVAQRLTAEPTAERVRELTRAAKKRKTRVDPRTLEASCFVLLLTDLSSEELPAAQAPELYRLRWRVETAFKRLKSILQLDALRAADRELAAAYLYGKLVGALLLERASQAPEGVFPPLCGSGGAGGSTDAGAGVAVCEADVGVPEASGVGEFAAAGHGDVAWVALAAASGKTPSSHAPGGPGVAAVASTPALS